MSHVKVESILDRLRGEIHSLHSENEHRRREHEQVEAKIRTGKQYFMFLTLVRTKIADAISEGRDTVIIQLKSNAQPDSATGQTSLTESYKVVTRLLLLTGVTDILVESVNDYLTRTQNADIIETDIDTVVTFSISH